MSWTTIPHLFVAEDNLIGNPRFEAGVLQQMILPVNGEPLGAINPASGLTSFPVIEGSFSLTLTSPTDKQYLAIVEVAPDDDAFTFSATVGFATAAGIVGLEFYSASSATPIGSMTMSTELLMSPGLVTGSSDMVELATVTPGVVSVTAAVPEGAAWVAAFLALGEGLVMTDELLMSDYLLMSATQATFDQCILTPTWGPVPFFDGDSGGGCVWTGQRWFSPSQRPGAAADLEFMLQLAGPIWSSDSALLTSLGPQ